MLARLQQLLILLATACVLAWGWWCWQRGQLAWAALGPALLFVAYAGVLAVEFGLLYCVHGADPTPRASGRQLFRAWWAEVQTAPLVFCWRQPFRSRRWPDRLPEHSGMVPVTTASGMLKAEERRGVLLIHGFVCNRGLWNLWLQRLLAQGIPVVAVNLEPVFVSIDDHVHAVDTAVRSLRRATGLAPVVVAHSMGGLVLRRWYSQQASTDSLRHVLTLGSPHRGTWLARLGLAPCVRQMTLASTWLTALASTEQPNRMRRFTCFYSHCDNIVFPPINATLAGADNRHLPGVAHVHMVDTPEPWTELLHRLALPAVPSQR